MASIRAGSVALCVAIVSTIGSEIPLDAQVGVGTWSDSQSRKCRGDHDDCRDVLQRRTPLIYRTTGSDVLTTVESPFDGSDVPVMIGGKPSGGRWLSSAWMPLTP